MKNLNNMPEKKQKQNDIINLKNESGLAEFTKRPLPSKEELEEFEDIVNEQAGKFEEDFEDFEDEKEEEIEESLSEIYQDDDGHLVDVKHLQKSKGKGFIFWFVTLFLVLSGITVSAYYFYYNYYLPSGADASTVDIALDAKTEVVAGEEFFYEITYRNPMNVAITNVVIELKYPDNFIFSDSQPEASNEKSTQWRIDRVGPQSTEKIKVKGCLVGPEGYTGLLLATMAFEPENFSSEFKKEKNITTSIQDIGLNIDFDYSSNALVGEKDKVFVQVNAKEKSFFNNFRLSTDIPENAEINNIEKEDENALAFEDIRPGVWKINEITNDKKYLPIEIIFKEKTEEKEKLKFVFEYSKDDDSSLYNFYEEEIEFEVMKSDLNLALIINGARSDQGVNFGDTLNYSIVYNNKGEAAMKDVVIMAVMESDFLDWTSLVDESAGTEKGNTITWTKNEIEGLAEIAPGDEGSIDFSIKMLGLGDAMTDSEFQVKSYAQFNIEEIEDGAEPQEDNKSNTIINKINSDLSLKEAVRYFNDDNIPVGTGPHPPLAGEETTYKVYWEIDNNLHELEDLKTELSLPDKVFWDGKDRSTAGEIKYDPDLNKITWEIGRLPITVFQANAEFSIKIKPTEEDKNKIMVLYSGTKVSAVDSETEAELSITGKAKTTRLEDDDIAKGDGIVE